MFLREALFADRSEAGRALAQRLLQFKDERPVVLALPRGGVPVGFEVARALDAPLDLVLVRKIGAPFQPELALGAVVDGGRAETVLNEQTIREFQIPESYIAKESARQLAEIERRRRLYLADRPRVPLEGRTTIVVDDGIATGATMEAALHAPAGPIRSVSCWRRPWRRRTLSSACAPRLTRWSVSRRPGCSGRSVCSTRISGS